MGPLKVPHSKLTTLCRPKSLTYVCIPVCQCVRDHTHSLIREAAPHILLWAAIQVVLHRQSEEMYQHCSQQCQEAKSERQLIPEANRKRWPVAQIGVFPANGSHAEL